MASVSSDALLSDPDELLRRVEEGEEIVIERNGRPVARMAPIHEAKRVPGPGWQGSGGQQPVAGRRKLGWARDRLWIADDFYDPITEDDLLSSDEAD